MTETIAVDTNLNFNEFTLYHEYELRAFFKFYLLFSFVNGSIPL